MKYILLILSTVSSGILANFSPTIINIKKDIEQLYKEKNALEGQWMEQVQRLRKEEKQRTDSINKELHKKMIEVQAYWPAIKKEIESTCTQLPDSCEGAEAAATIPCCANLQRMAMILQSTVYAPNTALFDDVKQYFYTYMIPLAAKKKQQEAMQAGKPISEQEARERAKKELDTEMSILESVYELRSENK